jgi:hypothetical protein
MRIFKTHTGEIVKGARLTAARARVADEWRVMIRAVRATGAYAAHVTSHEKDENLALGLAYADRIRGGLLDDNATIWQRINTTLTGECVALLAKVEKDE